MYMLCNVRKDIFYIVSTICYTYRVKLISALITQLFSNFIFIFY